jgi:hypothetical protein
MDIEIIPALSTVLTVIQTGAQDFLHVAWFLSSAPGTAFLFFVVSIVLRKTALLKLNPTFLFDNRLLQLIHEPTMVR